MFDPPCLIGVADITNCGGESSGRSAGDDPALRIIDRAATIAMKFLTRYRAALRIDPADVTAVTY